MHRSNGNFRRRFPGFLTLVLAGLVLAGSGCTSRYQITLTNNHIITSKNKPKLNEEKNIYEYKNARGERSYVPVVRVRAIEPFYFWEKNKKPQPTYSVTQ